MSANILHQCCREHHLGGCFKLGAPPKTAANRFQNILHLFIAKRADHEVCGGHDTKKNYNWKEGKAVKI